MNEFFNKYFNIKQMIETKREYKQQMKRVDALPKPYQYVFKKIQEHMWSFASGDGYDMLEIHFGLIDLFEEGALAGKEVLEITGEDVATFADDLLKNAKTYPGQQRHKLNRNIHKQLEKTKNNKV